MEVRVRVAWIRYKVFLLLAAAISVAPGVAFASDSVPTARTPPPPPGYISINGPYRANIGEPFFISISLEPASEMPVAIQLEQRGVQYSPPRFTLRPHERKLVSARITSTPDGIGWIHAMAEGYEDSFLAIDAGFLGHMEPTTPTRLPYNVPMALTLSMFDKDHKPFSANAELVLHLESSDGALTAGNQKGTLELKIRRNATVSPQFQITSRNLQGGVVHLSSTLTMGADAASLDSESITLPTDAAEWLPIFLAICGGLLYGVYRILKFDSLPRKHMVLASLALLASSGLAGFVGYLVADFDLLGLKLDPTVLRTYPLLGFLVAYIGVDTFLKDKLVSVASTSRRKPPKNPHIEAGAAAEQPGVE